MYFLSTALSAAALASLVTTTPCADSIGSGLQILLHNDLYGNESTHSEAVIVLGTAQTHERAKTACAALSESLWPQPSNTEGAAFLTYLTYQSKLQRNGRGRPATGQLYHVSGLGAHGSCKSIDVLTGHGQPVACETRLPALCTQSAPLSYVNNTDSSVSRRTRVTSGNAAYTGWRDKLSFRFLGIKYGSFPQRFTDSSPASPTGEVSALDFGSVCASRSSRTGPVLGSEDCLFLNIYTPYLPSSESSKSALRPVMLWVSS
jgi:hypothetical protein